MFPFSGHIDSFFGDLQVMGFDGMRFDIETKSITTHWFDEKEMIQIKVDTGDGTILRSKCPNLSR
jgi:malonate-semialdehyde dehydrogenase (acetylating)/methylmalonate-semialdehyde dehydrogenase